MDELKLLKAKYENGKIDQAEYLKQLDQLLTDEAITQEELDEAKEYDPENAEPLIYSQKEVNGIVKKRALREIRKYLRKAGVEVDDIADGDLEGKVVDIVTAGAAAGEATPDEKDIKHLKDRATLADKLEADNKGLQLVNKVMGSAGKYNPVDVKQVVRALTADYTDLLEYEDGQLVEGSVEKAVGRIAKAEPNLFHVEEEDRDHDTGKNEFNTRKPGGGGGGNNKDKDREKKKKAALEKMGYGKKD